MDGLPEPIPAVLIEGAAAERLLKAAYWDDARPTIVLAAQRPFPADTVVRLIWGRGIAAEDGVETQEDQTLMFKTRPEFKAELTCERASADAGCLPFAPVTLALSAPVAWTRARGATLRSASGKTWKPAQPKRGSEDEDGAGGDARWITSLTSTRPWSALLSLPAVP